MKPTIKRHGIGLLSLTTFALIGGLAVGQPPATLAQLARQVWERMHLRPPGLAASVVLLGVHAGAFFGTPIAAVVFHARANPRVVEHPQQDGDPALPEPMKANRG